MASVPVLGSIGELMVEFVCAEPDLRHARAARYDGPYPSGAPGIFIDQAARQGVRTVFAGAVGADAFGSVILARLRSAGVDDRLLRRIEGEPTGTAHLSYNSDGSREFVFNIASSAAARVPVGPEAERTFLEAGVTVLHVSGSSLGNADMRAGILDLCERLRQAGVALSLDPNIRPELVGDAEYLNDLRGLMAVSRFVLPSEEDARLLWPGSDFEAWGGALIAGGAQVVALKRGAAGARALDAASTVAVAGHDVDVVDPTGAGDCFCATLVALLVCGAGLATALRRANAAGALAVMRLGPMEGNSTPAEVDAFLADRL